jgi:hypothetical protein
MQSYEVLRQAADGIGVKALAAELRLSPALVYKWCQPADRTDPDSSGARNPLDRLSDLIRVTGDTNVANWLCHQAGGFFVRNPNVPPHDLDTELLVHTQRLVDEFAHLLSTVTRSIENDGRIDPGEANHIRQSWERLKSTAEQFSVACEKGTFGPDDDAQQSRTA